MRRIEAQQMSERGTFYWHQPARPRFGRIQVTFGCSELQLAGAAGMAFAGESVGWLAWIRRLRVRRLSAKA